MSRAVDEGRPERRRRRSKYQKSSYASDTEYEAECGECGEKVWFVRERRSAIVHTAVISGGVAGHKGQFHHDPKTNCPPIVTCGWCATEGQAGAQ